MTLYQKLKRKQFNFASIGLEQRELLETYFCTPKGAKIIGWAGVDGIHYCMIRGFGEMIFAVSPMNLPGDYVHPIAKNFEDLLGLLAVCGSMDAIEQAHLWNQEQFDIYVKENRNQSLSDIVNKYEIPHIENPFIYIKELQSSFDYSRIKYTEDYYDIDLNPVAEQEWKVTFEGSFYRNKGRAGKEIPVRKEFAWGKEKWYIPAIYACKEGLVVDFCKKTETDEMKAFMDKWNLPENMYTYSEEQQELIRNENPMGAEFTAQTYLNGKELQNCHGYGTSWIPENCIAEGGYRSMEAKRVLEHYHLDFNSAWTIRRCAFLWATKNKPAIKNLNILMKRDPEIIYGTRFVTPVTDGNLEFEHPATGMKHTLHVREFEFQQMKQSHFRNEDMEYPEHFAVMTYTIEPEIDWRDFMLRDCNSGDNPRMKNPRLDGVSAAGVSAIAVIGGADGPTAVMLASGSTAKLRTACSSLYFEKPESIEWRMEFQVKTMEDKFVELWHENEKLRSHSSPKIDYYCGAKIFQRKPVVNSIQI